MYGASESGWFFAISCDSNRVISEFPLYGAFSVCYDSLDNKAFCTYHDYQWNDSLLVVDGSTHSRVKAISIPGATIAVWDQVLNRVYVSCQNSAQVAVVDAKTNSLLTYIPVGACPMKMYVNTLRQKLYVLNYDAGSVFIVNMATNQVIKTVAVGGYPNIGYYCCSADKFYGAGPHNQCVVIGGQSDTVVKRISLPGTEDLFGATGNESAGLVYLGTFTGQDDYVATVSAESDSVIATAWTGREPWGLAYSSQSGMVYSASSWSDEVYVLSGDGARVLRTLQVADCPAVFACAPRHRRLYLGHLGSRYVYVLRDTAVGMEEQQPLRPEFCGALSAAPNPFRGYLRVQVKPQPASTHTPTEVRICAADGRVVGKFRLSPSVEGTSSAVWDGRDLARVPVPAGVYVVTANSGDCLKVVKASSGPDDRLGMPVIRGGRRDTWSE